MFLTCLSGFTPLSCPFRIFRCAVVEKPSLSCRVRFFRRAGVGRPSHHVDFVFSMCHGGETLSVTLRPFYSTCRGGETLLVTSISYFRCAVVRKPSLSRRVHFIQHFVVGKSSPFAFLMFQGEKPFPSCRICLFRHLVYFFVNYYIILMIFWRGNPYGFNTLRVPVPFKRGTGFLGYGSG